MTGDIVKSAFLQDTHEGSEIPIRLADFIRINADEIVAEWEEFASTLTPASDAMTPVQLRNHIRQMLDFLARDMESKQTPEQERTKSIGKAAKPPGATPSELHAALRLSGGFDIKQMVSEFRALRASIMRLWDQRQPDKNPGSVDAMRFNETIDQMISETVSYYTRTIGRTRELFVAVIGHDLRNPLQAVMGCVDLLPRIGSLTESQASLCRLASSGSQRMIRILDSLVDLTRARLGAGLEVTRAPMDAGFVTYQIVQEMQAGQPMGRINVDASGSTAVEWDKARYGQLVTNLIGNALQYGFQGTPVTVVLDGTCEGKVKLSVHNIGLSIPGEKIRTLFDPLTRAISADGSLPQGANLGLGLFIANDIVVAHGGSLSVTSTEEGGTTFTASLPRDAVAAANSQP